SRPSLTASLGHRPFPSIESATVLKSAGARLRPWVLHPCAPFWTERPPNPNWKWLHGRAHDREEMRDRIQSPANRRRQGRRRSFCRGGAARWRSDSVLVDVEVLWVSPNLQSEPRDRRPARVDREEGA